MTDHELEWLRAMQGAAMGDYELELLRAMRVALAHVTWFEDPTVEGARVLEDAVAELSVDGQEHSAWILAAMLGGEPSLAVDSRERLVEVGALLARGER
jgi:hypothetical protein